MAAQRALYQEMVRAYMRDTGLSYHVARSDPFFRHAYSQLRTHLNDTNKSPDSPLARALVDLGLRDSDDWWDVGDTPSVYYG